MANSTEYSVVLTTTATKEDAHEIGRHLLDRKLAACVQVFTIESLYTWKGEMAHENEFMLFIKTRRDLYSEIENAIRAVHKYETPEIVQLPIIGGASSYLNWINEVTG